jgi:hypothetical protein
MACCTGAKTGTCPLAGSCAIVQNSLFAVRVPLNGVCVARGITPETACTTSAECKTCVGSKLDGLACTQNTQCRGCIGGDSDGKPCVVDAQCTGGGTCEPSGAGTCTGPGTCRFAGFDIVIGPTNVATGERSLTIPADSVVLNPAIVSGVGTACVSAGGDGMGIVDCDGGAAEIDFTLSDDHNTTPGSAGNCATGGLPNDAMCNTPFDNAGNLSFPCLEGTSTCDGGTNANMLCTMPSDCPGGACNPCNANSPHPGVCNSGTKIDIGPAIFAAGDARIVFPLAIKVLATAADNGPDGLACTDDDLGDPPASVPVVLSTGTNTVQIFDAGNTACAEIGPGQQCGADPCIAQITGKGVSCANLDAENINGTTLGGGFPAYDTQAGDIGTTFQFILQKAQ